MSGGPTWTEAEDDLLRGMSPRSYYAMVAGTDRERGLSAIKARKTALNQIGSTKKPDRPQTVRHPAVEATGGIDESVPLFSVPTVSGNKPARYSKNTPQTELTRTFQDKRENRTSWRDHLDGVPLRGAVAGRTPVRGLPLGGRLARKIGIALPV